MQKIVCKKVENVKKTFRARWIDRLANCRVPYFWQSKPGSLLREIDRLSSLKQDDGEGEGEGEEDEQDPKNSSQFWEGS